jgi:hypothetical protein
LAGVSSIVSGQAASAVAMIAQAMTSRAAMQLKAYRTLDFRAIG